MIYVLSDIHGQQRRFDSILKQINLQPEDTLYVLGDVVDRNPDGIRILKRLRNMPNVQLLLGNHENMMLKAMYYPHDSQPEQEKRFQHWYRNGGKFTHDHLKHLRKSARAELFAYVDALPLNASVTVNGRQFLLTHAAPLDMFTEFGEKYANEREFALWWRGLKDAPLSPDRTVIFGHTGTHYYQEGNPQRIWYGDHCIDIDCGASYPEGGNPETGLVGRLACLRLDDMKEFYSEEFPAVK